MLHKCGGMENKQDIYIRAGKKKPWLIYVDADGFEEIYVDAIEFCPYCGDVLDNEFFEEHEMVYKPSRDIDNAEILAAGSYFGVPYYVCSLGNHPVCYIEVSGVDGLYGESWNSEAVHRICKVEPHGGFSWSDYDAPALQPYLNDESKWFLGWDYAHCGDYSAFEELMPEECRRGGRKWTTAEMVAETKRVISGITTKKEDYSNNVD